MGLTMKCPKCNYTSFDYLTECKKCGQLLDGVKQRLNLQLSKPTINMDKTVDPEAVNPVADLAIDKEKTKPFTDQEAFLSDTGEQKEDEFITVSNTTDSLPPLEGLDSMENMQNEDLDGKGGIKFDNAQAEKSQEIITGFDPSDEQLEEPQLQDEFDLEEEMPELDIDISDDTDNNRKNYNHEKVIELTEDDQIFDLELDLNDKESTI